MRELGLNPSKSELEDLVNEADINKDGVINFEEFLNLMSASVKETDTEKELLEAFKVFDKDGSGTISTEELRAVLKSLGEDMTDADVDEMIKLADKNGDGQIDCEFLLFLPFSCSFRGSGKDAEEDRGRGLVLGLGPNRWAVGGRGPGEALRRKWRRHRSERGPSALRQEPQHNVQNSDVLISRLHTQIPNSPRS